MNPPDLPTMLMAVQSFAKALYPDQRPTVLIVQFADGHPPLKVPIPGPQIRLAPPARPRLSERQSDILQAVEEADGAVLVGKDIAAKAGHEYTPDFRKDLSTLAKLGLLDSMNPGYRLPGGDG